MTKPASSRSTPSGRARKSASAVAPAVAPTLPPAAATTPSVAHTERTQARVLALQYLYSRDVLKGAADEESTSFFDAEGIEARPIRDYAERLIRGVMDDQVRLDLEIQEAARNWSVGRMPAVDRNIVRICWYEMRTLEVPPAVAINEAIELGKEFSTENSGAFINGVLDQLHKTRLGDNPLPPVVIPPPGSSGSRTAAVANATPATTTAPDAAAAPVAAPVAAPIDTPAPEAAAPALTTPPPDAPPSADAGGSQ